MRDDWPIAAPESLGFQPHQLHAIASAFRQGRLRRLHGVVVIRRGQLVFEQYFPGRDERWGHPLGEVAFGADTLHDVRSVTKSVVSLLYGIAQAHGQVSSLDQPVLDAFPEYPDLAADPARRRILVRHALTMTMGTEWDETISYADARNSERRMEDAPDRFRFVLDRPLVHAPGERWIYNGGSTAVIARIVARGTGRPLLDFAREHLFAPLGITAVDWVVDHAGEPLAASGLRLRPRDLARIGQLVLDRGRWGGRQIVAERWLEESFHRHVPSEPGLHYGYQWWLGGSFFGDVTTPWVAGFGNGGQRLVVLRDLDTVIAVTAGNYDQPDHWRLPVAIVGQFVLPALVGGALEAR